MKIRIGHGFDVHKFGAAQPLILCGVEVPYETGLSAPRIVIHNRMSLRFCPTPLPGV